MLTHSLAVLKKALYASKALLRSSMALRPINMKAIHGVNFKEFKVRRSYSVVSWACLHIILPSLAHSVIDSIPVWFGYPQYYKIETYRVIEY